MFPFKHVRGASGLVKVGPHVAATLSDWTITPQNGSFFFVATVKEADTFWLSQAPRDLRLPFGAKGLVWRAVDLAFADGSVSGTLPPLEG